MIITAESQQRITILGKWLRSAAHFRDHARIIEHRVPDKIGHKNFQQRSAAAQPCRANSTASLRPRKNCRSSPGQNSGCIFPAAFGERVCELAKSFRARAGREVINLVRRVWFLVQSDDGFRHIVHRHDIDAIRRSETAAPAARRETRTRAPYRIASFRRGGCHPARCWGETRFAEHPEAVRAPCARRISWCARRDRSRSGSSRWKRPR